MSGQLVIDVSNNDPIGEADLRASGAVALICKATEGSSFQDTTYPAHREAARAVGILFGGYVFLHPGSPGDEAAFFLDYAKPARGDLQPVIDAEVTDGQSMSAVARRVDSCAGELEGHGYRPLLYASTYFWLGLHAARPSLKRLRVWEADYPGRFTRWFPWLAARRIRLYHGATVVLWQWTDRLQVGANHYDASRLFVPLDTLRIPRP